MALFPDVDFQKIALLFVKSQVADMSTHENH